jgi:branched-chain amino acid transport system permease protein
MSPSVFKRIPTLATIAALIVAVILPFTISSTAVETTIPWICIAVAALGLNLATGYGGQVSIGHGALYGVGAYTCGLVVGEAELGFAAGVIAAALVCFVVGILIGLPALRIKGLYLALVTLSVGVLFPFLLDQLSGITKSPSLFRITTPQEYRGRVRERLIRFESPVSGIANDQWQYLWCLVVAVICFVLVRNLMKSRTGRAIVAVRDNEVAAETNGVNVAFIKVATFGMSSALAGVGGALFALHAGQLSKGSFLITASLYFLVAMFIGGPATIVGPALGAVSYGIFENVIRPELPEKAQSVSPLLLGVILILLVMVAPGGIIGSMRKLLARFAPAAPTPS